MSNVPVDTDITGKPVAAMPIRIVDGDVDQDETGKPVAALPIRLVTEKADTDSTGKPVDVQPIVQVAGLTTTDELGNTIPVRPAKISAAVGAVPVRDVGASPYSIPAYFRDTRLFPWAAVDNGDGTFGSTFDPANFKDSGGPYYISPSGNDTTGDGSSGNPWRTHSKALTTAPSGSLVMVAGGQYPLPAPTDGAGKAMSFVPDGSGTIYWGNLILDGDVTSWGTPSGGAQQITLATGTIGGFLDLTKTDPVVSRPKVSRNCSSIANIAAKQGAGYAGIYRPSITGGSTASTLGASDGRDLTHKFGTEILAWRIGTPTTYIAGSAGGKLYIEDHTFVGEQVLLPSAGTIVTNNCDYLGGDSPILATGLAFPNANIKLGIRNAIVVTQMGAGNPAADAVDCNVISVLENVRTYQVSLGSGDQSFTSHAGANLLINCYFIEGQQGATGTNGRMGIWGTTLGGTSNPLNVGAAVSTGKDIDAHCAGITWATTGVSGDIQMQPFSNNVALLDYDGCTLGRTYFGGGGPAFQRTSKPTGQQVLAYFDMSNTATLLKSNGSPVSADGDLVAKILCSAGTGAYITITGTVTYKTDEALPRVVNTAGATWAPTYPGLLAEDLTISYALKTADTNFYLFNLTNVTGFVDFRSTGNPFAGIQAFAMTSNDGITVDAGSKLTTASAVKAALCNNAPHVLTLRNMECLWTPWRAAQLIGGSASTGIDASIYGIKVYCNSSDTETHATETALGAKMGIVI